MALPVLTSGRRRRRRWPFAVAALLAVLALVVVLQPWSRGSSRSAGAAHTQTKPPPPVQRKAAPPPAPVAPTHVARPLRPPVLLTGMPTRHRYTFHPRLNARGAILVNERTGKVLWALDPYRRLAIASTTKIMTALLVLERVSPDRVITISRVVPRVTPNREGLRAGERVRAWKLLNGLLIFSGNDDALALAQATSGSRPAFLRLMNERARALGLTSTHFTTPSGVVDRGNYSTAWDLASLARYALRNPVFRGIVRTRVKHVRWAAPTYSKVYVNKNALLTSYRGADGVKTGWTTKARHCLVASAHRGRIHLLAVVLGSWDAFSAGSRLLDYGFRLHGR
jgi:serine-type D-Ala-D-Ala carboxypeptidase (penicillin-binding protein 5/6)